MKNCFGAATPPDGYFQNFEHNLASSEHIRTIYQGWEQTLASLDASAWEYIKAEAAPRLKVRDGRGRGWEQLFDILNEARAYRYLKQVGSTNLRFIPRSDKRTPDLGGSLKSHPILCEVKTINVSDNEVAVRTGAPKGRVLPMVLSVGFFKKLRNDIEDAKQQMATHDPGALHYVYLNVLFDDFFGEYKETYFGQIDQHLASAPVTGVRIIVSNESTAFYAPLKMISATVDNIG
ncbi:MAG TPA: hypothetical protein VMF91_05775 [Bryobacteraceae bacterium]|nr:hypothetical protein [Bryobacteraceae bacterium]